MEQSVALTTYDGHQVVVLMRTPGDDDDLVRGFLWSEAGRVWLAGG